MTTQTNDARQVSIDAVRGFAVLGILLMNIVGMGMPAFAYIDPNYYGGATDADLWTWAVNFVLTDGKMRGLFTMLFGASALLIADRAEGGRLGPISTHYRRMVWLFVFGMIHAYLLWWGDILVCYALAGLFIFPLRNVSPRLLIIIGAVVLAALLAFMVYAGLALEQMHAAAVAPGAPQAAIDAWTRASFTLAPPAELGVQQIQGFRGGFLEALAARTQMAILLQTAFMPVSLVEAIAQMLIGMGLYRLGFFSLRWTTRGYLIMAAIGYLIAAPFTAWLAWRAAASGFEPITLNYSDTWSALPRPFIALAHASVILLIVRAGAFAWFMRKLTAAGRMALSNYLASSIITTFVFCGFGLGLYGALSRAELLWVVAGVWAFILIWSEPWMKRFHYGPFEWAWRSLVQWRLQPWRKRAPAPA